MKKKNIKDNKLVKWVLFLAVMFGAVVYGAQPGWYGTILSIGMFVLGIKFFIDHILTKKK